jgi:hypothetical protein
MSCFQSSSFYGKTQLLYLPKPKSICGLICTKMGLVQPNTAVSWWEHYKDMIANVLNANAPMSPEQSRMSS